MLIQIIIFILINSSFAIELTCVYDHVNWGDHIESIYQCKVINSFEGTRLGANVTDVNGTHKDGKVNSDVTGILFKDRIMKYLPRGITNYFENLIGLSIEDSELLKITKEDMKGFPKLKHLSVILNFIKVLEKDLLKFNPDIIFVSFKMNQINRIDGNVFDDLKNLQIIHLEGNNCIKSFGNTKSSVARVLKEIKEKCSVLSKGQTPTKTTQVAGNRSQSEDYDDNEEFPQSEEISIKLLILIASICLVVILFSVIVIVLYCMKKTHLND